MEIAVFMLNLSSDKLLSYNITLRGMNSLIRMSQMPCNERSWQTLAVDIHNNSCNLWIHLARISLRPPSRCSIAALVMHYLL